MKRITKAGKERKHIVHELGGDEVAIYKMSVRQVIALLKVLERYIAEVANVFAGGGDTTDATTRFSILFARGLAGLIELMPDDVLKIIEIVVGVEEEDSEWFEAEVAYDELIDLVPILDELNDFSNLQARIMNVFDRLMDKYAAKEEEVLTEEVKE